MPKIWIDAGHGGYDPGATAHGRTEKTDNLKFALALAKVCGDNGVEVVLTREDDRDISAAARAALETDCDLAVSCHRNAGFEVAKGVEIWVHSLAPQPTVEWAADVIAHIEQVGMPVRPGQAAKGVYRGYPGHPNTDFWVNRNTKSPSMLLEMGFLTNRADNLFFDTHLNQLAEAAAKACLKKLGLAFTEQVEQEETDGEALHTLVG